MTSAPTATPSSPRKTRVQAYPAFGDAATLCDFLARASWHFAHVPDLELFVPLAPGLARPDGAKIPEGFDPAVQAALDAYLPRVRFQFDQSPEKATSLLARADIVVKWVEGNADHNKAVKASGKQEYRVDPVKVRQEGSNFIQCALDQYGAKDRAIRESSRKFELLAQRIGRRRRAWVLATGPSIETYASNDYDDSVVIVCNSVVLNDELMQVCKPSILVFADPIFHFGVSQYAGRFREIVQQRLDTTDLVVVVPFKYYPLVVSKFPAHADRIIGVPFEKMPRFNLDLRGSFKVKTTANILTLLLLPLATTFASEVHITGCDGRPLDQDDYFWGHGSSVQINDKMENIRKVHPGFFNIDYNEYYFEHCHTLDNLLVQAEREGRRAAHHGMSYIPALRDRPPEDLALPLEAALSRAAAARQGDARACIVVEPDGVGMEGHYVRWHRNLIGALAERFERVDVLCNRTQDPTLYSCPARPTFTSFSWFIARSSQAAKADFPNTVRFRGFVAELEEAIHELHSPLPRELSIYMYYGSVQILKAMQDLRAILLKLGCELKVFVCLFHESVILEPNRTEPMFPPNAGQILMQAAAQKDVFRVASVTERLAEFVLGKFGVATEVFTNPTPGLSDAECDAKLDQLRARSAVPPARDERVILLPTRVREEKGSSLVNDFIGHLARNGVPSGHRYLLRGDAPEGQAPIPGVQYLGEEISDADYWANLHRADVMIVPYVAPCFTYRTSGILVDALMSGTPSIVVSDTWLADVVDDLGTGLSIRHRGPLSIASAIKVLLDNRHDLSARMTAGTMSYLARNNWRATAMFAAK